MKRLRLFTWSLIVCGGFLCGRLFYIGVIDGGRLAEMALAQRTEKIEIKSPRGIIYDRNMLKLADSEMKVIVKDGKLYYTDKRTNGMLNHVIGYISGDGSGCGIEGAFDYVLTSPKSSSVSYLKDINNNMKSDYAVDVDKNYGGVCLTIDYHIQKITEEVMDKHSMKGAAIVVDCASGEIVAMASRPDFDRHRLEDYLDGTDGELVNKAIVQYNPGSVFKIVVAAAALESAVGEDLEYDCAGKQNIGGIDFVCHKEDGHGRINLQEAFAQSCNCVFYQVGMNMGVNQIHRYATAFGIGKEVLNINGIAEEKGFVPQTEDSVGEIANVSIGQGQVMVTPLQMADIVCTLCNGGVRKQLTLIKGIVDNCGKCVEVGNADVGRVVSSTTARRLMDMMRQGVEKGTGRGAHIDGFGAGGKTGSAETGWEKDGELMQQGWFAGFFPKDNPRYVCIVIAENGKRGSDSACPVFREIGSRICQLKL